MRPEDIPPSRMASVVMAACLLGASVFFLYPTYGTLYYDGFRSIWEWPSVIRWFLLFGILSVLLALQLLFAKKPVGATVQFHEGGFTLDVRHFFRQRWRHRLSWRDIENMRVVEAARNQDVIAFRLTPEAAVREGLVPPDRPSKDKKRDVSLPIRLCALPVDEAAERFLASAELAGAQLEQTEALNLVFMSRRSWTVFWP